MKRLAVCLSFLASIVAEGHIHAAVFYPLGDLPGNVFRSHAADVSANGSTVVGHSMYDYLTEYGQAAFRWTPTTGMVHLPHLAGGANSSGAGGVSGDGSIVVGHSGGDASRWIEGAGVESLGAVSANDVSANGSVTVGASDEFGSDLHAAIKLLGSSMVQLDNFPPTLPFSSAQAVSNNGQVVGWARADLTERDRAFRWRLTDGLTILPNLIHPGTPAEALGISPEGSIIVGGCGDDTSGRVACFWRESGGGTVQVGLGDLPGGEVFSTALGASDQGSIIVGAGSTDRGAEAFIWREDTGLRNLQNVLTTEHGLGPALTGWTLTSAQAVTPNGRAIAGDGINPAGDREAWLVWLDPLRLHWTNPVSGDWDVGTNWDYVAPAGPYTRVFIQPDERLTVLGPEANMQIGALTLGARSFSANLDLRAGTTLHVAARDGVTINLNSYVRGNGVLSVDDNLYNYGTIAVRLDMDPSSVLWNYEHAYISAGAAMDLGAVLNSGLLQFWESSHVRGSAWNASEGTIVVGNGTTTFHQDLINHGGLSVHADCTALILGDLAGSGTQTGSGTVDVRGEIRPGSSPGTMSFEGNLTLGPEAHLMIELGGTKVDQYDALYVDGLLSLNGTLEILLVDDFMPGPGNSFEILRYGGVEGDFAHYKGLELDDGLRLDFLFTQGSVVANVVPEPSTLTLLGIGAVTLLGCAWRKRRRT